MIFPLEKLKILRKILKNLKNLKKWAWLGWDQSGGGVKKFLCISGRIRSFWSYKKNIGYNSVSANRARLTVTGVQLKYLVFLLSSNNNNRSDNDCLTKINCLAKTFILATWTNAVQTISESQTLSPLTTCLLSYPPNSPSLSSLSLKSFDEWRERILKHQWMHSKIKNDFYPGLKCSSAWSCVSKVKT